MLADNNTAPKLIDFLSKQKYLACDIETTGLNKFKDDVLCLGTSF